MPNFLSSFKKVLQVEVEHLLFLERLLSTEDTDDVKFLLSSEKSIEHEGETEYTLPLGHSDKLEMRFSC